MPALAIKLLCASGVFWVLAARLLSITGHSLHCDTGECLQAWGRLRGLKPGTQLEQEPLKSRCSTCKQGGLGALPTLPEPFPIQQSEGEKTRAVRLRGADRSGMRSAKAKLKKRSRITTISSLPWLALPQESSLGPSAIRGWAGTEEPRVNLRVRALYLSVQSGTACGRGV